MTSTPCASILFMLLFAASKHDVVESFAPVKVNGFISTPLFYQQGSPKSPVAEQQIQHVDVSNVLHIDDSNHEAILNNTLSLPVLVDCYTDKCGPCKLIERSLQQALPKFISSDGNSQRLQFVKWDAETKDASTEFISMLREHDMTFRKLPTLILFVDGIPIALKSGMMSAAAIDRFLEEELPDGERRGAEPRPRVGPEGALGVSTRKMNR